MTDDEVSDLFQRVAVRIAKPVLNGDVPRPNSRVQGDEKVFTILWEHGYLPARNEVLAQGATEAQVYKAMAAFKLVGGIIEPSDLVVLTPKLKNSLRAAFMAELPNEPRLLVFRLDERVIRNITKFRVEMYTDEGPHRGRPHVKVHLKNGAISISLDDPPVNLTPRGGIVGEATALKIIAKHRTQLLETWEQTRPDTQRLCQISKVE